MPAAFAELVVKGGLKGLKCPLTGIDVFGPDDGFDSNGDHSPYLRVFVDWVGGVWAADPTELAGEDQQIQKDVIRIFENPGEDDMQYCLIEECVRRLSNSALVLAILDPPVGSFGGEICYAMFDFGSPARSRRTRLKEVS